jgi:hypothetical protein
MSIQDWQCQFISSTPPKASTVTCNYSKKKYLVEKILILFLDSQNTFKLLSQIEKVIPAHEQLNGIGLHKQVWQMLCSNLSLDNCYSDRG